MSNKDHTAAPGGPGGPPAPPSPGKPCHRTKR